MKKLTIFAIAAFIGAFAVACNNGNEKTEDETTQEETVATDNQETTDAVDANVSEATGEETVTNNEETQSTEVETTENVEKTTEQKEETTTAKPKIQKLNVDSKQVKTKAETEKKSNDIQM